MKHFVHYRFYFFQLTHLMLFETVLLEETLSFAERCEMQTEVTIIKKVLAFFLMFSNYIRIKLLL